MKKIFFLLFVAFLASCKQTETPTPTGSLRIRVSNPNVRGLAYEVIPEAVYLRGATTPSIKSGLVPQVGDIVVPDLNQGNYYLYLYAGTNWYVFLQVTAGKERLFEVR